MPKRLMEKQMNDMSSDIQERVIKSFIIPFVCFSLFATFLIVLVLRKVSIYLTDPIINLFTNIHSVMQVS
jgi:hypothetical protein